MEDKVELFKIVTKASLFIIDATFMRRIIVINAKVNELVVDLINNVVASTIILLLLCVHMLFLLGCLLLGDGHLILRIGYSSSCLITSRCREQLRSWRLDSCSWRLGIFGRTRVADVPRQALLLLRLQLLAAHICTEVFESGLGFLVEGLACEINEH